MVVGRTMSEFNSPPLAVDRPLHIILNRVPSVSLERASNRTNAACATATASSSSDFFPPPPFHIISLYSTLRPTLTNASTAPAVHKHSTASAAMFLGFALPSNTEDKLQVYSLLRSVWLSFLCYFSFDENNGGGLVRPIYF